MSDYMNIKTIILIILGSAVVVLFVLLYFQKKRSGRATRSRYIDALYALIEGRREDALKLLTVAVRNGENDVDAYIQLGNLLRERNQAEKALQIHKGLTVRRDLGYEEEKSIQLALAEDLSALGKTDRAIKALETIHGRKRDPEITKTLHRLYHRNGDFDEALNMLRYLMKADAGISKRDIASYLTCVASRMMDDGDFEGAGKYLERARKEDRSSVPALYLSGKFYMQEEDLESASRTWESLLATDISFFEEIIPILEKNLFDSGRFQRMGIILEDLLKNHPSHPHILESQAELFIKKGDLDKGINLLEEESAVTRNSPSLSVILASMYLRSGDQSGALKVLEESRRSTSNRRTWECGTCGKTYSVPFGYCAVCSEFNTSLRKS